MRRTPIARVISSIGRDARSEKTNGIPSSAAARRRRRRRRGRPSSTLIGHSTNGLGIDVPPDFDGRVVRGDVAQDPRNDALSSNAERFSRSVSSVPLHRRRRRILGCIAFRAARSSRSKETGTVGCPPEPADVHLVLSLAPDSDGHGRT